MKQQVEFMDGTIRVMEVNPNWECGDEVYEFSGDKDALPVRLGIIRSIGFPPRIITREELNQQQKEDEEKNVVYPNWSWIDTELPTSRPAAVDWSTPPPCAHKWKDTPGLMRMYRDCEICKAKWEDVYPNEKY